MSVSVFEKLLGSYSGMRKRTWTPSVISEASEKWWAQQFSLGDEIDAQTKISQYQMAKANIQKAGSEQGNLTPDQAAQQLQTYGQAAATVKGVQVVNRQGQKPMALKKDNIPVVIQALDSLIQKAGTEKSKKPDSDKSEKDKKKEREGLSPMQRAEFSPSERIEISRTVERALGIGPEEAMKIIDGIEQTINTPRKKTKVAKLLSLIGIEKPELVEEAKQQLKNGTGALFSVMSKVQQTSDGGLVLKASDLTSAERDALKILTIRNNGNIFIGRPGEYVEEYKTLQESAQYGDSNYGFTLGAQLSQFGPLLQEVRLLEGDLDVESMSKEEIEGLPKAFQSSKSGTGSGSNDAVGKFKEYVAELDLALKSGDKAAIKEAREKVKNGLEKFGSIPADITVLETPLDDEDYDVLEYLVNQVSESGGLPVFIKNMVREQVASAQKFNESLGIQQGDVVKVGAPSQSSLMGERPDIIAFVRPEAKLNTNALGKGVKLHVVTPEDTDLISEYGEEIIGTTMVNTSIKVKKEENSLTRAGSGAVAKMLGSDTAEYDELRNNTLDMLVADGAFTPEQRRISDKALERDRAIYEKIDGRLSRLNPKNTRDVVSFLRSMEIDETTISGREKFQAEAKSIAEGLSSDDPEMKRLATIKVFQLYKIRKAATSSAGSDYARGAVLNDAILSFAARREEPLHIQSPTRDSIGSNHTLMKAFAKEAFNPDNNIRVDPARSNVTTPDGRVLFGLRRVARKGKNAAIEFELGHESELRYMKSI